MLAYDQMRTKTMCVVIHPGRCGSKSLVAFMNKQPDCYFTWEQSLLSPQPALSQPTAAVQMMQQAKVGLCGDTDPAWLWHLGSVIPMWHFKIIYLHRDADEIADSYWSYCEQLTKNPGFNPLLSYPFLGINGDRADIYRTVRWYQETVAQLMYYYKDRIYMVKTADLNDEPTQIALLNYLGIPSESMVLGMPSIRHWGDNKDDRRTDGMSKLEAAYRKQMGLE